MKKFLFLLFAFLVACNGKPSPNGVEQRTSVETIEDDFVYRIQSVKDTYEKGERVELVAELEYKGDKDFITIYHAASPFIYNMKEKTRGFDIGYPMDEPLITTTLNKGEPLQHTYQKSGGYGSQDTEEYVAFIKKLINEDGFPEGEYEVTGIADFYVEEDGQKKEYEMEGKINFIVK